MSFFYIAPGDLVNKNDCYYMFYKRIKPAFHDVGRFGLVKLDKISIYKIGFLSFIVMFTEWNIWLYVNPEH